MLDVVISAVITDYRLISHAGRFTSFRSLIEKKKRRRRRKETKRKTRVSRKLDVSKNDQTNYVEVSGPTTDPSNKKIISQDEPLSDWSSLLEFKLLRKWINF